MVAKPNPFLRNDPAYRFQDMFPTLREPRRCAFDAYGITFAVSNAQARWNAVQSYREAWGTREWPTPLRAVRVPQYDGSPDDKGAGRIFISEEYVRLSGELPEEE